MTEIKQNVPFRGDAVYVDMQIDWLAARARRLAAEHRIAEDEDFLLAKPDLELPSPTLDESAEQVAVYRDREVNILADIEGRLKATEGWQPALDATCQKFDLDEREQIVLLASLLPCLGDRVVQHVLGCLDSFVVSSVTLDTAMVLVEAKTTAERLTVRAMFSPKGRLVRHGLVKVVAPRHEHGPAALALASVRLTDKGFIAILGDALHGGQA